jgi:hypothetical protein
MKKNPGKKQKGKADHSRVIMDSDRLGFINDEIMLYLTLILAGIFFLFSRISDGMYQHDEAAHFVSMRSFWHKPSIILGNWAKPGYKLIFVIPSLLGEGFVTVINCLVAAITGFFAYKTVRQLNGKYALLAFILVASQPIWFQLSFRNYSEIITALLLVLTLNMFFKKKILWAGLILSYSCLIRQEFFVLLGIFGIYLLVHKHFRAILAASVFPILNHVWGFIATGDPLYLVNQILGTTSTYGSAYPRQGLGHYPLTSEIIFGIIVLLLLFVYLGSSILSWKRINWWIFVPAILFFGLHCLFNSKTLEIGPASGGNLRYMAIISPLIAIMAALSLDAIRNMEKRYRLLIFLLPLLFVAGYFWSYKQSGITLGDERDWRPLIVAGIASVFLLIPIRNNMIITLVFSILAISSSIGSTEPIPNSPENETMEKLVKWYNTQIGRSQRMKQSNNLQITEDTQIYSYHVLFLYYQGKTDYNFNKQVARINEETMDTAGIGSLILWDSHYTYRPRLRENGVPEYHFIDRPN